MASDSNLIRLTGLWKGRSKKGTDYLSGSVSPSSKLLIFPNSSKSKESDPDYVAYLAPNRKEEDRQEQATQGHF